MEKEFLIGEYAEILDKVQNTRVKMMKESAEAIMTETLDPEDQIQFDLVNLLTGELFSRLADLGVKVENGKTDDMVKMSVGDKLFVCSRDLLKASAPAPAVAKKELDLEDTFFVAKKTKTVTAAPVKQEAPAPVTKEETPAPAPVQEVQAPVPAPIKEEEPEEEEAVQDYTQFLTDDAGEEEPVSEVQEEPAEANEEPAEEEISAEEPEYEEEVAEGEEEEEAVEVPVQVPEVGAMPTEIFVEEKIKNAKDFIFDTWKFTIAHSEMAGGGKAEEMQAMVAPLKIQKFECSSVPVLVSIKYKGKMYSASSYDIRENGKNLVQIDVDEFYFLVRGYVDGNGKFQSTIVTTGPSANQGDKMTVLSRVKSGMESVKPVNGHLKFTYQPEEGGGVIEVVPFLPDGNEYIVIARNNEFCDYHYVGGNGMNKALIYEGSEMKEVIVNRDGDMIEADLMGA